MLYFLDLDTRSAPIGLTFLTLCIKGCRILCLLDKTVKAYNPVEHYSINLDKHFSIKMKLKG